MLCKKCNKEIENSSSVCPFCGEKCAVTDDFFHEMLTHVMEENTQSSEQINKLKEDIKKRKKDRKKVRTIAIISVIIAAFICTGIFAFSSIIKEKYAYHGDAIYRAGFDGTTFSVYDENGNEIKTISGNIYTENTYGSNNQRVNHVTYNGFVSFEKTVYENSLPKTLYIFDGISGYTYKDFSYTTNNSGLPVRASYSSKSGENTGVYDYIYDENGNKTAQYIYEFVSHKEYTKEYDSVGRKTGEKEYSTKGELIWDKQYSYKSDGTLYLSSINEVYKTDATGTAVSYKLTNFGEDGKATGTVINSPDGELMGTVEYTHDDMGRIASAEYYDITSTQTGWELYEYYENGDLKKYAKKDNGIESTEWYTYTYHENGSKSAIYIYPSEGAEEYISQTIYDTSGRIIKYSSNTENTTREYNDNGKISVLNTYSTQNNLIKRTVYTYNSDGNCILQKDILPDGSVIQERTYAYDGMGNLINQAGGDADHLYINEYDEANSLSAVSTYRLVSSETAEYNEYGFVTKQTIAGLTYGFDRLKDGRISDKYTYNSDGSILTHVKYEYNSQGDQIGLLSYNPDGSVLSKTDISYDDRLKIIKLTTKNNDGDIAYSLSYNYSIDRPSVKISGTNRIGKKNDNFEYEYSFDGNGYISNVIYFKNKKKTTEYEYTHDEIGEITSGLIRQLSPPKNETNYKYTYNGGHISSVISKSPDGTETKTDYALDENKRPYQKTGDIK